MISKSSVILAGIVGFSFMLNAAPLATINGRVISVEEFNQRFKENMKFFQFKTPSKKGFMEDLIKREIGIQEAKKTGLDQDPEVVERMNTVLYQAFVEKKLAGQFEKVTVADTDAKAHYEKYPEIRTSNIFVAIRPGATKEEEASALEKIQNILNQYVKPGKMSFAEVAQKYSDGQSAAVGGDLDFQPRDKLDATYYDAALKLKKPGALSGIVRSRAGFHVIKLTAIRPWRDTDQGGVKRVVFEEKRQEIFDRFMKSLKEKASVSVNWNLISE